MHQVLLPVIVGKAAKPRTQMDCIHDFPAVYISTINAWFTSPNFSDWFSRHLVPEVRHYQENVLRIGPEDAKALLLLDNAPAHPDVQKLVCAEGKIRMMFLPPSATSIKQPMDHGVIVSCRRSYERKYQEDVLVVIEEEEDT